MRFISKEKIKDFGIYGLGQAINIISPLLVIPYIVMICGESGLGKIGVGFSFALIAIVLVDYSSYINGTKQVSICSKNKQILEHHFLTIYTAKSLLLLLVLLICTLLIFLIPFFEKDKLQIFLSLFIVVGQFINPTWFFQGIQSFKWISIINVSSKIIYVTLVFLFIKQPEDYILVNAFIGLGSIIASLAGFIWIYRKNNFSVKNTSVANAVSLIKEDFSLTVSQLFFSFYQYLPIIIISFVCGDFIAGQYRIIDQVIMIFRTYLQMFFNFIYAEICLKIYEDVNKGFLKWKLVNGINYLFILILVTLFFFNSEIILSFFKVSVSDINILSKYFKIGLLIPVFMGISFALKQLIFSFNKNNIYIIITIISTIINVIIMYFFLKNIGLKGAFLSTIFVELLIIVSYALVLRGTIKTDIKNA